MKETKWVIRPKAQEGKKVEIKKELCFPIIRQHKKAGTDKSMYIEYHTNVRHYNTEIITIGE